MYVFSLFMYVCVCAALRIARDGVVAVRTAPMEEADGANLFSLAVCSTT